MRILVTGANGYLGRGIVAALIDKGCDVIAADISVQHIDKRAIIKEINIFEIDDPFQQLGMPDILLHLAWRDGFAHYSDAHMEDLPKHCMFIKKMAASNIKTLAVMGSMHEIGFFEGSINENTPCNPQSFYGIAKNALRDYTGLIAKQSKVNLQWLRGYYIVGTSPYGSSIFSKITAAEKDGQTSFPFTMGLNQFDFLDYDVFCEQVAASILQNKINGIINICSGRPEKLRYRVERFIKENGYKIKLDYGAFPDRSYDSKAVWGDSKKIEQILMNNAGN